MVSGGSSPQPSSVSIQEKGRVENREPRDDPPLSDPNINPSSSGNTSPDSESFPTRNTSTTLDCEHCLETEMPVTGREACGLCRFLYGSRGEARVMCGETCDVCRILYGPGGEQGLEETKGSHWDVITEIQLEELILGDLDKIFKSVIKWITPHGYTEEVATNAVLQSRHCYVLGLTISKIVDEVLAFLGRGHEVDSSLRENSSVQLRKLEKSVLHGMVSSIRGYFPYFRPGDAMFVLLYCDMNLVEVCAFLRILVASLDHQSKPESNSNSCTSSSVPELTVPGLDKPNHWLAYPTSRTEIPTVVENPSLPYGVEESYSTTISQSSLLEQKLDGSISCIGMDNGQANAAHNISLSARSSSESSFSNTLRIKKPDCGIEVPNSSDDDKSWRQWVSENKNDVLLYLLDSHKQKLLAQGQGWERWVQLMVKQAARRLNQDKAELQTLRRLKIENSQLQQEKEASKLQAEKESMKLQEALSKEKEANRKNELLKKENTWLSEDLVAEKRQVSKMQQRLEKAKDYHAQTQANWRHEQKLKGNALAKAESERKEREKIEVRAKTVEDKLKSKEEKRLEHPNKDSKLAIGSGSGDVQRGRGCVKCLGSERSVLFLPCAHNVLCAECNELLEKKGMKDCPSCWVQIQRRIHVRYD